MDRGKAMSPEKAIMALYCLESNLKIDDDKVKKAIEVAKEALARQIPESSIERFKRCLTYRITYYHCPNCKAEIQHEPPYCQKCGQALNWS